MSLPSVLVDPAFRRMDEIFSPADRQRLNRICDPVWARDEPMPLAEAQEVLPDVVAVICSMWRYGDALYGTKELRAILTVSGGFPHDFDYEYCHQQYIRVLSAAPAFGPQVAEMALGMAIASARGIVEEDRNFRTGTERYLHASNAYTFMLFDQPVGFIGFGSLADNLRSLLAPFRPNISVYDPWVSHGYIRSQGCTPVALDELMSSSRVIFVLAVPSSENAAMLNRELLEMIRSDAIFLLISRSHVVDFDALTELVLAGRFRAAIDVFPEEPLSLDHPIRSADKAILSAHRAGTVPTGLWDIGHMVVDDLEAIVQDLPPRRLQAAVPELASRYVGMSTWRRRSRS